MLPEADNTEHMSISTGMLPPDSQVQQLVESAHKLFASNTDGQNADHYLALARAQRSVWAVPGQREG